MLRLRDPGLARRTRRALKGYQEQVDSAGSYAARVAAGRKLFDARNRQSNPVFRDVRCRLADMCPGARRCGYREDSAAGEIERIRPKDLCPEAVFVWENYLLSRGICNRRKSNRFAVRRGGKVVDVTRPRGAPIRPPRWGAPAPVDPRREDPLDFLYLDILDTFMFQPRQNATPLAKKRAHYTIEILDLNRDVLLAARGEAYGAYRARLAEYRDAQQHGADAVELRALKHGILTSAHPTVWREMGRQQLRIPKLRQLFAAVPEALGWRRQRGILSRQLCAGRQRVGGSSVRL